MRFDLTDLRLFLAVVDAGSITHGAAEVGLSLPAASERLRDMEAVGEVTLLNRGRRGVAPTEAGEMLAHHARTIQHQMAQMRGDIGQYAKGLRASVRIFANTAAITEFLPERLGSWMAAHPQIDVDLKERESGEIAKSVGAGFAEIGVLSSAVETDILILRPFAIDRLVVVATREHPLARGGQVRFADLLGDAFVGMAGGALQDHIESQASRLGTKMKMRVRLRSFQGICRMAGAGTGIGIIPESAAKRCQRSTEVAIIRLRDEWATRRLSLCVRDAGDPTAERIRAAGFKTVGLLGTAFTMEHAFYKGRLADQHGLNVIVPDDEDRATVHRIIYEELVAGRVLPASRDAYRAIIARLVESGAEAVILGCTEIMLLVRPEDSQVPIFDTTALHATAAIEMVLAD